MIDMEKQARELVAQYIEVSPVDAVKSITEALEQAYREGQRDPDWEYLRSKSPISSIIGHIGAEYLRDIRAEERQRLLPLLLELVDPWLPVEAVQKFADIMEGKEVQPDDEGKDDENPPSSRSAEKSLQYAEKPRDPE